MADKPLYYGSSKGTPMYYGGGQQPMYGGKGPMYYGSKRTAYGQYGAYGNYGSYGNYGGNGGNEDNSFEFKIELKSGNEITRSFKCALVQVKQEMGDVAYVTAGFSM